MVWYWVLSDLSGLVRAELDRDGITGMIGEDHIFETVQEAVAVYRSLEQRSEEG